MNRFAHLGVFFSSFARPYPARDWLIALLASFLVFLGLAFYGASVYVGIESGSVFESAAPNPAPAASLTRGELDAVVSAYEMRAVNWNARNFPAPPVFDPSLPAKEPR